MVNLASSEQIDLAGKLGSTHGSAVDKFAAFGIRTQPSEVVAAPHRGVVRQSGVQGGDSHPAGPYTVYLCDVVSWAVDESKRPVVWHRCVHAL